MTTEQKNKVIALFDEWKIEPGMEEDENPFMIKGFGCFWLKDAQYHSCWSWLMPIVEKIESFKTDDGKHNKYKVVMYLTCCDICCPWDDGMPDNEIEIGPLETKITSVHEAVFQFCNWYLNQKP